MRLMTLDDIEIGTELICVIDGDASDDLNYQGLNFTVYNTERSAEKNVNDYHIQIENKEIGLRNTFMLAMLNGVQPYEDDDDNLYKLRMIPFKWMSEKEQFAYRMTGQIPK